MLTDRQIKGLQPKDKDYKVSDGAGLFLLVTPAGGKLWRFRYRLSGKDYTLAIGKYPLISLLDARAKRDEYARSIMNGVNPTELKNKATSQTTADELTFDSVARAWMVTKKWTAGTQARNSRIVTQDLCAPLTGLAFNQIKAMHVLSCLKKIEARGAHDVASRARGMASEIFCYGIGQGYCETDPAAPLQKALVGGEKTQRAAIIEPRAVGQMMRTIGVYDNFVVRNYLILTALTMLRPSESRLLTWAEINWDERRIELPAERMLKTRLPHLAPLSEQAYQLLRSMQSVTGRYEHVFTSSYSTSRNPQPISNATPLKALRIMGIEAEAHCTHGFRTTASTILNEAVDNDGNKMWESDWIERQLSHVGGAKNAKVRAAYNRALYLKRRAEMLQWYADYLDFLAAG